MVGRLACPVVSQDAMPGGIRSKLNFQLKTCVIDHRSEWLQESTRLCEWLTRSPALPCILVGYWSTTSSNNSNECPLQAQRRANKGALEMAPRWKGVARTVEGHAGLCNLATTNVDQQSRATHRAELALGSIKVVQQWLMPSQLAGPYGPEAVSKSLLKCDLDQASNEVAVGSHYRPVHGNISSTESA